MKLPIIGGCAADRTTIGLASESIVRAVARQLSAKDLIARMDADVPSDAAHALL